MCEHDGCTDAALQRRMIREKLETWVNQQQFQSWIKQSDSPAEPGYHMWGRRGASPPCPGWWGRALWGRWSPSVGAQPPGTVASWWPPRAPRPALASSPPPPAAADWDPAAGLETRGDGANQFVLCWRQHMETFSQSQSSEAAVITLKYTDNLSGAPVINTVLCVTPFNI